MYSQVVSCSADTTVAVWDAQVLLLVHWKKVNSDVCVDWGEG